MKTIKIFAMPSHGSKERVSGVDYARIIQPMQFLDGYQLDNTKFKVKIFDPRKDEDLQWDEVAREYNAIYFNYTAMAWEFAKMGLMARKAGIPLIMDLDDSLWDIVADNPAYEAYKKGSEGIRNFTAITNEVDYITTTCNYLKNVICDKSKKTHDLVEVFPNRIDLSVYSHRTKPKNTHQITLLHAGSTTHFIDLQEEEFMKGIDMIMKEYPNVILKTVGAMIPKYKERWGRRYEQGFGHVDVYKWATEKHPKFMDECDIFVTPLQINSYTKCKSSIKFLEVSSSKRPGVWQNIRQYKEVVKDGVNGFLASNGVEWYRSIKRLIDEPELRVKMGEAAFKTVDEGWRVEDYTLDRARYFKSIIETYMPQEEYLTTDKITA